MLVKAALHLAAFRDVHQRALIAHHAAGVVANGGRRVQAHNGSAVLANQGDFLALDHRLALDLILDALSLCAIDEDLWNSSFQHFFLGIVAQHAHQRWIDVQDGAVRRGDVDAFLQRLKELRETSFILAKCRDVAPENRDPLDFAVAHHGVGDAIEEKECPFSLHTNLHDSRPLAPFHEPGHRAPHQFGAFPAAFLQKIREGITDDLREGHAHEIGKTAVNSADLAVQRERQQDVVERIDQVAKALLRPGDHGEQLVELLFVGWGLVAMFHAAHQPAQFRNFLCLLPYVRPKQDNDDHDKHMRQRLIATGKGTDRSPRRPCKKHGQREQHCEREPPEFLLPFLELVKLLGDYRTRSGAR